VVVAQVVKEFPPFMEPEKSLPCSRKPATLSYPEPGWSSLHPQTL